jgi:predicted enzyme related to lactoylglutathione lyase
METNEFLLGFTTDNPQRLSTFYRDTVGLPSRDELAPGACAAGGAVLGFGTHDDTKVPTAEPSRVLIDLVVGDARAERVRLEARGVEFMRKEGVEEWGGTISTFNDPDGNIVQLMQLPEGMAPPLQPGNVGSVTLDLTSENPEALLAFYRDVVGLAAHPAMGPNGLSVKAGVNLRFDTHSETCRTATEPQRRLINFMVDDVRGECARMEAAGARFFRKEGVEFWGGIISSCLDPDGNIVQIIEIDPALAKDKRA